GGVGHLRDSVDRRAAAAGAGSPQPGSAARARPVSGGQDAARHRLRLPRRAVRLAARPRRAALAAARLPVPARRRDGVLADVRRGAYRLLARRGPRPPRHRPGPGAELEMVAAPRRMTLRPCLTKGRAGRGSDVTALSVSTAARTTGRRPGP